VVDAIPVTDPVRTLIDLASRLPQGRVEAAVNAADRFDLVSPEELRSRLAIKPHPRGVAALRRLLDDRTFGLTDSELERRFLILVRRAGLPQPDTGVWLNGFKVDFHWPELELVVETDGLRYHRTASQQARDRRRDQAHAEAGIEPLRFTHGQVRYEADEVIRTLRIVAERLRLQRLGVTSPGP
jgi:very-short-patch-repair endonuclease